MSPPNRTNFLALSPDGNEVVLQRMDSPPADEGFPEGRHPDVYLSCVKTELDAEGFFKSSRQEMKVPRCQSAEFLSSTDWPRIHIWNGYMSSIQVADVERGAVASMVYVAFDAEAPLVDPAELESGDVRDLVGYKGQAVSDNEGNVYCLPHVTPVVRRLSARKLHLTHDGAIVLDTAARPIREQLRMGVAAVSGRAHALFAVQEQPHGGGVADAHRVLVFNNVELSSQREMRPTLDDVRALAVGPEGDFLYALDAHKAAIAVLDIASGQEVRLLEKVARFPVAIVAVSVSKIDSRSRDQ